MNVPFADRRRAVVLVERAVVMHVILKCVTSVLSAALREITRPLVVCVSSFVVALVTLGVSAPC